MVHVTEKAQVEMDKFFQQNQDLNHSIRIYLQAGG
jgi:Fe-S cluster assembly iron-binding protein IscA